MLIEKYYVAQYQRCHYISRVTGLYVRNVLFLYSSKVSRRSFFVLKWTKSAHDENPASVHMAVVEVASNHFSEKSLRAEDKSLSFVFMLCIYTILFFN